MSLPERIHLLGEKTAIERMIAATPQDAVIDRASLTARLGVIESMIHAAVRETTNDAGRVVPRGDYLGEQTVIDGELCVWLGNDWAVVEDSQEIRHVFGADGFRIEIAERATCETSSPSIATGSISPLAPVEAQKAPLCIT